MAGGKSYDEMAIIHNGATVSDLATIFDMTPIDVNKRLVGKVVPVTAQNRSPRYRIRDAAPYLCNVVFDIEEFLKTMTPAKLPPQLMDVFWKGQKTRQQFERDKGELWDDTRVREVLAEVFKTFRMTALMFADTLEQQTSLSPDQRLIIQGLSDGLLDMAHKNLVKDFEFRVPADNEHGRVLKEEVEPAMVSTGDVPDYVEEFDDGFGDD